MPLYAYRCPRCSHTADVFKKLAEIDSLALCTECITTMQRQISAPAIFGDYQSYECPVTGKQISGRRAHEENLKRTGCRLLDPGERQQNIQRTARAEQDFDNRVEATVEEFYEKLPTVQREQLAVEIQSGADVQTIRS